jgi:hypothetical protein
MKKLVCSPSPMTAGVRYDGPVIDGSRLVFYQLVRMFIARDFETCRSFRHDDKDTNPGCAFGKRAYC